MRLRARSIGYRYLSTRRYRASLVSVFIIFLGEENRIAGDAIALARPVAEVDQLAALRAKRSVRALFSPDHNLFAGGAVHFQYALIHGLSLLFCALVKSASVRNC